MGSESGEWGVGRVGVGVREEKKYSSVFYQKTLSDLLFNLKKRKSLTVSYITKCQLKVIQEIICCILLNTLLNVPGLHLRSLNINLKYRLDISAKFSFEEFSAEHPITEMAVKNRYCNQLECGI